MSTSAAVLRAGGPRKPGCPPGRIFAGCGHIWGGIRSDRAGMVALAIMGLIGVLVPLATGVITDTLAGSRSSI